MFANGGYLIEPYIIKRIENLDLLLTASVTPDPREAFAVTTAQRKELKFQQF